MSQAVLTKQNPSSPNETRRDQESGNTTRRSLSGKFRNLFRKNSSSSPNHATTSVGRTPPATTRQRSLSPESVGPATEAPHLQAPTIHWPFGKKKSKLPGTSSEKIKKKETRKTKKSSTPTMEISTPISSQEYQTSIRGQNFVPRTPELNHETAGRTQSSSTYETTTKGFRDYMVIDNTKSSQQINIPDIDMSVPPPYSSDRSRSPSLNHEKNIEISLPKKEIEINSIQKPFRHDNTSLSAAQVLIDNNPLTTSTIISPTIITDSNQSKNISNSSLNNTELHSKTSLSMDVDAPKLHAPLISLTSNTSNKKDSKKHHSQSDHDETYNSVSSINNHQSFTNTYSSLPDKNNENLTPLKPIRSNLNKYPALSAIVQHHMHPISDYFNKQQLPSSSSSTAASPNRVQRFDTSTTTTLHGYNEKQQWSSSSPTIIHHHDGFIRPLTPPKPSVQPDVSTIHINLDDLRDQSSSRLPNSNSSDMPIIYRSSTTIYTRDKSNYANGGELRTWSIQENDDINKYQKPSTSIQILPLKSLNEYSYNHQYSDNIYNSNLIRSSIINERDTIHDQSIRSYKHNEYTQEPFNTIITPVENSEIVHQHYLLKRTNSYDGLGILLSADAETHLNHRIRDIEVDSPGSRVGLRKNDRIIQVNGINVEKTEFGDVLVLIKQGLDNNNLQFSVIHEPVLL